MAETDEKEAKKGRSITEEEQELLDKATKEQQRLEQDRLQIDFDQAVEEERAEAIEVKFNGQVYELPRRVPAWLPLFLNNHMDENGVVPDEKNLDMIEKLLGKEFANSIEDKNFVSLELVNENILRPVMKHWGMPMEDVPEGGEGSGNSQTLDS